MSRLTSVLNIEYGTIKLVLFEKKNASFVYYAEKFLYYDGFDGNGFINPEDVFKKIQDLFAICQNEYGNIDKKVTALLPGVFYRFGIAERDKVIESGIVTDRDAESILSECGVRLPGYEATERIPLYYKSFSNPVMYSPVGEKTDRLYVTASVGYLRKDIKELIDNCAKRIGREFEYLSVCTAAAAKADNALVKGEDRIIVIFSEGHTDVALCKGVAATDVRSDLWGTRHVVYALSDKLGIDEELSAMLLKSINLNLAFNGNDSYNLAGTAFSVQEVNTRIVETLQYFAKEIKKCVLDMTAESEPPIYLTGSELCQRRGVREIFEDEIGRSVVLLKSEVLNLEGCKNYVTASYNERINNRAGQNAVMRTVSRLTNWRR